MIHTKEPTNCFYVYLSAYRSMNDLSTNLKAHAKMAEWLGYQQYARDGVVVESSDCVGFYREQGNDWPTRERSIRLKVACWAAVERIATIAHLEYNQEAVLVVNSQTHTATFIEMSKQGFHVRCACSDTVGTFQRMPHDANIEDVQGWTQDENRNFWWIV
ncbi:S-adenosyl-L-methionine hydrolase [Pectobacterium phage Q19]|uniref:S-adenosyl-L-methionine hydrolase n=1 Tax=Pectobacterium phage Q19 TaxID=2500576 RepID=A0A678ZKC2_9CAUD|nr:S-adenosyl-L-methionine hydrolase [Pectobacterium phage Q19]